MNKEHDALIDGFLQQFTKIAHTYTWGYVDPSDSLQWIPIVKNATTFLKHHLNNWKQKQMSTMDEQLLRFVLLRDPYERFISGLVEELEMYIDLNDKDFDQLVYNVKYCEVFLKFAFDKILLESPNFLGEHTTLQINLLKTLSNNCLDLYDPKSICYFKINDKVGYQLNHWLKTYGIQNTINNGKIHSKSVNNNKLLKTVQEFLFDYKNNKYKEKIYKYIEPDYIFLNHITFINE